ncbi:uncharacterized protein MELLADRAFT_123233 [Melampsora larici-populina 98AG31]|uniref:Secreted protein n=1 Tax=Melampsora larici-populina (strain 98AG31 / pathotype 3-4-7) TaxID=747676 RepID=F4RN63_MELLP|nr:uncharacterized protein MELLADRAFT_123233 [Melampsora larici-populina 98AG31]EGG06243.1 secreted protein [Melampsora larici-populina 98AG31]
MKNILSLLFFLQIFLIFGHANTYDRLSARSSASDQVSSTFVKRKTKKHKSQASNDPTTDQPSTGEQPMTCSISRYVRETGLASDCVCAIAFLYDPSFPACTICRTCVVQPLDSKEVPLGGRKDKQGQPMPPSIELARMNSAYDSMFKAQVYTDAPICDPYTTPPGLGDVAMACNASLAAQAYREAM